MSGIDRLRTLAGAWDELGLGGTLADIADQIERERDAEVADSPYDAILPEDRDSLTWVRDHGGLDHINAEWRSRSNLARTCDKLRAKVERQQRHIEYVQGKCRERQGHIVELSKELAELRKVLSDYRDALGGMCERLGITDGTSLPEMPDVICEALDRRLMPEGYEWPRYESGEPLRYEDRYVYDGREREVWHVDFDSYGEPTILNKDGTRSHPDKGERVNRPSPKVLDADGVDTSVGDTVYDVGTGEKMRVCALPEPGAYQCVKLRLINGMSTALDPCRLTHRAPVPAADGKPLREGETVWNVSGGDSVADTWERLEEDAEKDPCSYFGFDGEEICGKCPASGKNCEQTMARDLVRRAKKVQGFTFRYATDEEVRRCRALAERERGA